MARIPYSVLHGVYDAAVRFVNSEDDGLQPDTLDARTDRNLERLAVAIHSALKIEQAEEPPGRQAR